VLGAILRAQCGAKLWRRSNAPKYPSKAFGARAGTNSQSRALRRWISVFTVCDNAAREACPLWLGQPMTAHWGIPDPACVAGSPEQIERAFRDAFMLLDRRISLFLSLPLSTLDRLAIQRAIDGIGRQ